MQTQYSQYVVRRGKRPVNWRTGLVSDGLNAEIWLDFHTASSYAAAMGDGYGVGFVLTDSDPFFLIDLDHCRSDTGTLTEIAQTLLGQFAGCYTEVSQSGDGLHIVGASAVPVPPHRCRSVGVEFYHTARMISVTGTQAAGDPLHDPGAALGALIRDRFERTDSDPDSVEWTSTPVEGYRCSLSDDDLIEHAMHSRTNFALLWSGNTAAYSHDHNAADQALCNHLIYWTGGDCERTERLFGLSGLARDKWHDRPDYRQRTILTALSGTQHYYCTGSQDVEWVHLTSRGVPLCTRENVQAVITAMGGTCRYNIMKKRTELSVPGVPDFGEYGAVVSRCNAENMRTGQIVQFIEDVSYYHAYCPASDYVHSVTWDGRDRIPELAATLHPENAVLAPLLLRRWLIAAVASLVLPQGAGSPGVLVLQGDQGIGKTRWCSRLAPDGAFLEGAVISPHDKDTLIDALSYWIVELGEMERINRSLPFLKAFLTKSSDRYRAPYGRTSFEYPRRTVFIGTVNEHDFLRDETGNRRFLSIRCGSSIDYDHGVDMGQLWAQVLQLFHRGESWHLSKLESDMLADLNRDLIPVDELTDLLSSRYDLAATRSRQLTATEILRELGVSTQIVSPRLAATKIARFLGIRAARKLGRPKSV